MIFDLVCLGVVAFFALLGLVRGLVRQVFGLLGFLGGLVLAHLFAQPLALELGPSIGLPPAIATVALSLAIFIAVEVLAKLLGNLLHESLGSFTGTVNRLGGLLVGGAKGLLVAWAIASLASLLHTRVPQAEKKIPALAKLQLEDSTCARLALDKSFLGDVTDTVKQARRRVSR